jgi:RNA polymerase sigma factor (sigma-70 family)
LTQDHEIMLSVKNGDIQKLGQLFDKYSKGLYNYFRLQINDSSHSEDLVQNVFYSILKYRYTFKNGADFKVWMYTIARNEKISFFRKKKHFSEEIDPEFSDEGRNTPEEDMVNRADIGHLRRALETASHPITGS